MDENLDQCSQIIIWINIEISKDVFNQFPQASIWLPFRNQIIGDYRQIQQKHTIQKVKMIINCRK